MKKIRIGVFGAGSRGGTLSQAFMLQKNCEIVAVCELESRKAALEKYLKIVGDVAVYHDFDEFVKHDMDAVILANFFHEHAPYAIKCFEHGLHVFSECISNGTMAEGVELVRAFEKSNSIYMLAENYPQMLFNREMKRVVDGGTLGKILYAEGEYNHPGNPFSFDFKKEYTYFDEHWRNYLPRTYYITHSLGPVMRATGATPKKVSAHACFAPIPGDAPSSSFVGDRAAIIMTQNDDGSVFRVTGCAGFGAHGNSYRVCGTKGQIENLRGMGEQVMLRYNEWEIPEGMQAINLYTPDWNDRDEEIIKKSGHGGGDYLTARYFLEHVANGVQPEHPFDVYSAVTMSSVAILGHRSVLNGGKPYDIPDFRCEEDRKSYEDDRETPFYNLNGGKPTIPCCSHTDFRPTDEQMAWNRKLIEE